MCVFIVCFSSEICDDGNVNAVKLPRIMAAFMILDMLLCTENGSKRAILCECISSDLQNSYR